MDKGFKNIDELFRSKLENQPTPPIPDRVKANIDKTIGSKHQWPHLFYLSLLVVLLSISGTLLYFASGTGSIILGSPNHLSDNSINSLTLTPNPSKGYLAYNAPTLIPTLAINDKSAPTFDTPLQQPNKQLPVSNTPLNKTDIASSSIVIKKANNPKTSIDITPISPAQTQTQDFLDEIPEATTDDEKQETFVPVIPSEKTTSIAVNTTKANDSTSSPLNNDIATIKTEELPTEKIPNTINENTDLDSASNILPAATETIVEESDIEITDSISNEDNTLITVAEKNENKPWMIRATSGINLVSSTYQSSSLSEKAFYQESTSDNTSYQSNLNITYLFKNKLMLGTGIGYNKFSENYNFVLKSETVSSTTSFTVTEHEVPIYTYDANLLDTTVFLDIDTLLDYTPSPLLDTTWVTTNDTVKNETIHAGITEAQYLSIPLHFGTQIPVGRFKFDIYASARFNFLTQARGGYYLDNKYVVYSNAKDSFHKKFYTDFTLGAGIHYRVFKNIHLNANALFRPVIGNVYSGLSFNKAFHYTHLGIGLSIQL